MQVQTVGLSSLHPMKQNIRKHTEKQIKEYIRSIEMFGQIRPMVVDENGEIIAGNGMYQALVEMGRDTAECYILEGLSKNQKMKMSLADNRVYKLGILDLDVFEDIVLELGDDTDIPGWDEDLIEMMNASVRDIDKEISKYGIFSKEDIDAIQKKEEEKKAMPESAPIDYGDKDVQSGKYVICPKCGERIWL